MDFFFKFHYRGSAAAGTYCMLLSYHVWLQAENSIPAAIKLKKSVFISYNYSINPLPILFILFWSFSSNKILSNIPFINELLLGVLNSFDISRYSFIVTFTGIDVKLINSAMAIFISKRIHHGNTVRLPVLSFIGNHHLVFVVVPYGFLKKVYNKLPVFFPVAGNLRQFVLFRVCRRQSF